MTPSSTAEIVCPSGLSGVIRKVKLSDLNLLTNRTVAREPGPSIEFEICKRLWLETSDHGPYVFNGPMPPWATDVLQGDRFFTIMQARMLTRGNDYEFDVQCDSSACREQFRWGLDLSKLPTAALSAEAKAPFMDGNKFWTTQPDGTVVGWSLPTGSVQTRIDKFVKQYGRDLSVIYAARVNFLERVDGSKVEDFFAYFADQDADNNFDFLVHEMTRLDCGVETGITVECPTCGKKQDVDVGFGGDFFLSEATRKRRERPTAR